MDRKEENLSITSTEVEKAKEVKDGARGRERLKEEEVGGFIAQEVIISWGQLTPAKGISQLTH